MTSKCRRPCKFMSSKNDLGYVCLHSNSLSYATLIEVSFVYWHMYICIHVHLEKNKPSWPHEYFTFIYDDYNDCYDCNDVFNTHDIIGYNIYCWRQTTFNLSRQSSCWWHNIRYLQDWRWPDNSHGMTSRTGPSLHLYSIHLSIYLYIFPCFLCICFF